MSENQEIKEDFEEEYHECEGCKKQIPIEYDLCANCAERLLHPPPIEEVEDDDTIPEIYPIYDDEGV